MIMLLLKSVSLAAVFFRICFILNGIVSGMMAGLLIGSSVFAKGYYNTKIRE